MNRNTTSHFSASDNQVHIGRSKFNRNSWYKTTFNVGDLIPFYLDEVLPGDTFEMATSVLARMATPLYPVMDNAYLDTYYFFVPIRLVWDHWQEFNGQNDVNSWVLPVEYSIPTTGIVGAKPYSLPDYMGLPIGNSDIESQDPQLLAGLLVSVLPFRAYHLIWNEWFRDQNLQDPVLINKGDVVDFSEHDELFKIRKVNKFHDYFTSCLPAPQKGNSVIIPGLEGTPVVTGSDFSVGLRPSMRFAPSNGVISESMTNLGLERLSNYQAQLRATDANYDWDASTSLSPSNLHVGLPTNATIDSLRTAFQIQKLLWRDGNGGTRYTEIVRSHFGVVSPDARLQRPEYLGGKRIPLSMNQVIQQSSSNDEPSPLGNTGAYSKTIDSFDGFHKSFTEHGYIIGVCCVRTDHTYQQSVSRLWSRKSRYDFYYPELANIGEQPVYKRELYAFLGDVQDEVFGYQEAWAEYRYRPSLITGSFRSAAPAGSLDAWHYGDYYESVPYLSADWIAEPVTNVNRTLAVQGNDERHEQILLDMYFKLSCTRPMPVYSVPGLVDHF